MTESTLPASLLRDLGDGLILRRTTRDDAQHVAEFNGRIHGENPLDVQMLEAWTRDLILNDHPTVHPDDFLVVEDTTSGKIISSMCHISQTWSYEGIPFGVGRPELVGTDPAYRSRGLVRQQFEILHEWSQQRSELVQVITGIPNFYRQYGYEMALNLGGARGGSESQLPRLKDDEQEAYRVRAAQEDDLPWLQRMYERECRYSMVSAVMDEALWRHEISGKSELNINRLNLCVIESAEGRPVGYLAHPGTLWGTGMVLTRYALDENQSYLAVSPAVIRYLWETGKTYAARMERKLESFHFALGAEHPAYQAMAGRLPGERKPYAFYVRVPDLPAFLRLIAPALEARLKDSPCAGHSGELKISFYHTGVRLVFEHGRLAAVEAWKPKIRDDEGMIAFPNLTFLQLLFGFRSLQEVRHAYPDSWGSLEANVLVEALFPKKASHIWAVS